MTESIYGQAEGYCVRSLRLPVFRESSVRLIWGMLITHGIFSSVNYGNILLPLFDGNLQKIRYSIHPYWESESQESTKYGAG